MYVKGEVIEHDLPSDKAERLLRLNAIEEINATTSSCKDEISESKASDEIADTGTENAPAMDDTHDSSETPESGEEDEIPQIDITDGILAGDKAEAEKPKKKRGAKK